MRAEEQAHAVNVVGALSMALVDAQTKALTSFGRPLSDMLALLAIEARPASTVNGISQTLGLTHSGAVRAVDRLEAQGEIHRSTGSDRRAVALHPTARGRKLAGRLLEARQQALERFLGKLSEAELSRLGRLADRLLRGEPLSQAEAWRTCRMCVHEICRGQRCPAGSAVR